MAVRKSCVKGFGKDSLFAINPQRIYFNTFKELGSSGAGRIHVALFYKDTLDWGSLYVDHQTKFQYSPEIIHYYIMSIEGYVIGSLFDVSRRHSDITDLRLAIHDRVDETSTYSCTNELGHGGVTVYSDGEDSFLVIPNEIPKNSYTVPVD